LFVLFRFLIFLLILFRVFFPVAHNPTELNRQGPDTGTQYRSAIFYADTEQQRIAEAYVKQLDKAKVFPRRIVTQVVALKQFYAAEDYHQDYAEKNPDDPYIQQCDVPKMAALKRDLPELYVEK
jgi:peptide-methionine (S)-S-oxide reductase